MVDDKKAVALLLDLNIANIALNKYPMDMRDSMSVVYKEQICDIHKIEVVELDTLVWMMQNDFDRYNKLYEDLRDTLDLMEDKLGEVGPDTQLKKYEDLMDAQRAKNR